MHFLINVFIVLHFLLIAGWLFPLNTKIVNFVNVFRGYIVFIGLDQDYSMFAPSPRKYNRHIFALVTFENLSTIVWLYPRIENLPLWRKTFMERYRKFGNDNIVESCFKFFLPDFARYIARQNQKYDTKPKMVCIYLCEQEIADPLNSEEKKETNKSRLINLFNYRVEPDDLKE